MDNKQLRKLYDNQIKVSDELRKELNNKKNNTKEVKNQIRLILEKYSIKNETYKELLSKLNVPDDANDILKMDIVIRFTNETIRDIISINNLIK